ncbi:MAG: PIG-L family deacetylase [Clostridia bacterium]|nr:PIG-L family deacetylase [Clostridia bacterium]
MVKKEKAGHLRKAAGLTRMKGILGAGLLFLLLSLLAGPALAEEAVELTGQCRFESNGRDRDYAQMTDGELKTYFPLKENKGKKKGELIISCQEPIAGLEIMAFDKYGRDHDYDLQIREGEEWKTVDQGGTLLVHWHPLPEPVTQVRVVSTGKERLRLAEVRVFGPGEPPADVQRWETLEKCDIMLLTAHPDDEILWFAGLMPTYGGDRGYRIQVAVLVPTGGQRKLELLGAIWHCGVKYYPELLGFIDKNGQAPEKQYQLWKGKNRVLRRVTEVIRKHQPEVLITHGEKGEYGHGAHKTAADAAKTVLKLTGSAKKYPDSAKAYGTWQVKKLYLHEYEKNPITCDWSEPLAAFGGKTGYQVAEEAFQFHGSQVRRDWAFEVHGAHDNALFGLYYTAVGPDSGIGDLMEHIPSST